MEVIKMGLTSNSTGRKLLNHNKQEEIIADYTIAIAGNPNVGKSTIFNSLTGLHQHTGNWTGKTVANVSGLCQFQKTNFLLVDIPGTYSIMSHSEEEEIARDYICFGNPDATVVILDATCLERNLNLVFQLMEITPNIIVCVNLLDEAKKKGIQVDLALLEKLLGVPVVGTIARKPKTLKVLLQTIYDVCTKKRKATPKQTKYLPVIEDAIAMLLPELRNEYISRWVALKLLEGDSKILDSIQTHFSYSFQTESMLVKLVQIQDMLENNDITSTSFSDAIISHLVFRAETICKDVCTYSQKNPLLRDRKIDRILTSKKFGIPIMLLFLVAILWLTIVGANYPSSLLSSFFGWLAEKIDFFFLQIHLPTVLHSILLDGVYKTVTWVIAVMLPPMAIFFPLFTILEDLGFLPRIAFNLDSLFKKVCSSGKQALTMCMGFGCNAAGVVGCRIIGSPKEKLIAMLTNSFVPCNRKVPFFNYYF